MNYMIVNPSWNVPQSIIQNELLPRYAQRPEHLRPHGARGEHKPDGNINVSQPPGDGNALGRIKFNFPNKFLVYQHDTPEKNLFAAERRAFSHGCMRVEDPTKFGRGACCHLAMTGSQTPDTAAALARCSAARKSIFNFARPAAGAPDLSDRLRRRGRQAATARRHLRPGRRIHSILQSDERHDRRRAAAAGPQARTGDRQEQPGNPAAGRAARGAHPFAFFEQLFR